MSTGKYLMPYVYRVENTVTKEFYYGSRYNYTCDPIDDIWIDYFTSSKSVKKLIKEFGKESFVVSIIEVFEDSTKCFRNEQTLIETYISDVLCLNKQYVKEDYPVFLNKNKCSDNTKLKMSMANSGREPWNKGVKMGPNKTPMSESTKQKLRIAHTGKILSKEHRQKLSESHKGKVRGTYAVISCIHCGFESTRNNIFRWHNGNCKSIK